MDLSVVILLLAIAGLFLWLPLIGRKGSAILSYVIFGLLFGLGSVIGYLGLSSPQAGENHAWALVYLLVAAFSAVMILLTFFIYRHRQRKAATASATIN
jgi:heme/copper-type cytochrome/quinol oxidase subunit 2